MCQPACFARHTLSALKRDAAQSALEDSLAATPASMLDVSFAVATSNEAILSAVKALVCCLQSAGALRPGAYVEALMELTAGNQFAQDHLRALMGIAVKPDNQPEQRSLN